MIPLGPVVARARVRAQRTVVWSYFVDPGMRASWWPEARIDTRLGGEVAERWCEGEGDDEIGRDASGTIDIWVDGHAAGFSWSDSKDEGSTTVLITLRDRGVDTGVTVTETGFDGLPMAAERAAASLDGWQSLLADLVAAVDAGAGVPTLGVAAEAEAEAEAEGGADGETDADAAAVAASGDAGPGEGTGEVASEGIDADTVIVAGVDNDLEVPLVEPFATDIEEADDTDDADLVPLVLPGPPARTPRDADESDSGEASDRSGDDPTPTLKLDPAAFASRPESVTGDPDFDALIRGDQL